MQLTIYLIFLGLSFVALGYKKHYKQVMQDEVNKVTKYLLLMLGNFTLFYSLYYLITDIGISLALTYWFLAICPIIIAIALILTYKPKALIATIFLSGSLCVLSFTGFI